MSNASISLKVHYCDNHCLVVEKPAGILVQGDSTGDPTLVTAGCEYIKREFHKTGNVFLVAVHRLDRPVSGLVLLARTSKAASRLSESFRNRSVRKVYQAFVESSPAQTSATLEHYLLKDRQRNTVQVVDETVPGAQLSLLSYEIKKKYSAGTLLQVVPETGRSHQIRVQLSTIGSPILGDLRYGSTVGLGRMIALHATRLEFPHPTRDEAVVVQSEPPESWNEFVKD